MKVPIFHSYGKWQLSGVNTWTVNLIRAMEGSQFDSRVLFTGIPRAPQSELDDMGIPYDFLDVPPERKRRQEWQALKDYLEAHAPCIYITNFDFHRSCAVGTLSPEVRVVTVVHSDEACYFDELRRIGSNCNAIVCVSSYLTEKVKRRFPHLAARVHYIPYGIPVSEKPIPPRPTEGPIRLCYCNRLQQYQKRVFDLPVIATELEKRGVDYELDIAGDGPDAGELKNRFEAANLNCPIRFHGQVPNATVMDLCRRSHLFLLVSDFEGLPISLLEAMSVGCVPVVYQIESGIPDAIPNPDFGFLVPHGETSDFIITLEKAFKDRKSIQLKSSRVISRIQDTFSLKRMVTDYIEIFGNPKTDNSPIKRDNKVSVPSDLSPLFRIARRLLKHLPSSRKPHKSN